MEDAVQVFTALGFEPAGRFAGMAFQIDQTWRPEIGVYVWTQGSNDAPRPIRVGIACGPTGFGGRFDHYNRWLAGRFKADNMREQQVRSIFVEGLGDAATVWAVRAPDKPRALQAEKLLREIWGPQLSLDLMAKGSWGKLQMDAWRAAGRPAPSLAGVVFGT